MNIPGQIQSGPPMGILGMRLGIKHADIPEAVAPNVEDLEIQYLGMAWPVPREVSGLSQISESLGNNLDVYFLNLLT